MELLGNYEAEIFWRKDGPRAKLVYRAKTSTLTFYVQNVAPMWFPLHDKFALDDWETISLIDETIGREARLQLFEMLRRVVLRAIEDQEHLARFRRTLSRSGPGCDPTK